MRTANYGSSGSVPHEMTTIVIADDHRRPQRPADAPRREEDSRSWPRRETSTTPRYVRAHRPDVLILDLNMPGEPSLPAIPKLREDPATRVVVLTMQDDPAFAREALRAGAIGYVLKEAADDGARRGGPGRRGGRHVPQPAAGRPHRRRAAGAAGPPDDLTEREVEILRLIALGHTNARDRRAALPQRAHRRVAPRPHPAEDPADHPRRARALRARARAHDGLTGATGPSSASRYGPRCAPTTFCWGPAWRSRSR